jgi:hypothetical protein
VWYVDGDGEEEEGVDVERGWSCPELDVDGEVPDPYRAHDTVSVSGATS